MTPPSNRPTTFSDCLTARLEFFDSIQPHGAMLIADSNDILVGASQNIDRWLGIDAHTLLGQPWSKWLPDIPAPSQLAHLNQLGLSGTQLKSIQLKGRAIIMARHRSGEHTIIEFEAKQAPGSELAHARSRVLAACLEDLSQQDTEQAAAQCLLRFVALVTGFDRVMLLQFLPDWHGKVIDEVLKPDITSYRNQHFPANDIPQNARTLYVRKRQRLIADAWSEPIALLNALGRPFDLSQAELRAVHPAHVQYMRNMGTATSLSVSIVVNQRLWGLVVCHNLQPRTLSFAERQLCEHLANATGLQMGGLQKIALLEARHAHLMVRTHLKQELLTHGFNDSVLTTQLHKLRVDFNADGAWAQYLGNDFLSGTVPSAADRDALTQWLQAHQTQPVYALSQIPPELTEHHGLVKQASGILSIRFTEQSFLVLFRCEQRENIAWAGHPDAGKPTTGSTGMSPRTSFETWEQLTTGQATAWASHHIEGAIELRLLMRELLDYLSLERKTQTDALTGLANRDHLQQHLEQRFSSTDSSQAAVLMIDLDNFKPVNDSLGHAAGDDLLVQVAERIRSQLRQNDLLARLGGDEFAIVVSAVKDAARLEQLASRLLDAIRKPFSLEGRPVRVSASIGAALYPTHATNPKTLLHYADMAMYHVKHNGRDGYALYCPSDTAPPDQG